ncbi:MAG: trehalose utilization protein ThuA [Clostridiales bacterium]|nr:trehalose utilization protein ThuA [Clostridiales bacterium]
MIRVTIYNEFIHEQSDEIVKKVYPDGIHTLLRQELEDDEITVRTFTLDTVEEITDEVLEKTDVIIWWGHVRHMQVPDEVAGRVKEAVLKGMGAIFLHSAHHSKPFKGLMGTSCNLTWREHGDRELVWVCNPAHPIAAGIDRYIDLAHEEAYGEPFGVPEPDELVFIGHFEHGEVFRSGCCYYRERGRVFYFQPGHETYESLKHPDVIRVIKNAIHWAYPTARVSELTCPHVEKPID